MIIDNETSRLEFNFSFKVLYSETEVVTIRDFSFIAFLSFETFEVSIVSFTNTDFFFHSTRVETDWRHDLVYCCTSKKRKSDELDFDDTGSFHHSPDDSIFFKLQTPAYRTFFYARCSATAQTAVGFRAANSCRAILGFYGFRSSCMSVLVGRNDELRRRTTCADVPHHQDDV